MLVRQAAPFGLKTMETLAESLPEHRQISADRVRIRGRHWPSMLDGIVERAAAGLGAGTGVEAELYKLLVYDKGSFSSSIATPRSRRGCSAR